MTAHDVDLIEKVITVRRTKFFKTCLVPIGPKLAGEPTAPIERRRTSAFARDNQKHDPIDAPRQPNQQR